MSWSTPAQGLFVARGQTAQFTYSFQVWKGPHLAVPKLDASSGGSGNDRVLVTEWQGTAHRAAFGGPGEVYYALGVRNAYDGDVWFHLEGGVLA